MGWRPCARLRLTPLHALPATPRSDPLPMKKLETASSTSEVGRLLVEPDDFEPCIDERKYDGRADPARRAGNEDPRPHDNMHRSGCRWRFVIPRQL